VRTLPRDAELLGDMSDGTVVLNATSDEQSPSVHRQTGISVGHRGLLVTAELDNSIKPGGAAGLGWSSAAVDIDLTPDEITALEEHYQARPAGGF
jgi:hypothetical protein